MNRLLEDVTLYVGAPKHFKACAGVRNDCRTNVGVKIDPRTCLTLVFLELVSKLKKSLLPMETHTIHNFS